MSQGYDKKLADLCTHLGLGNVAAPSCLLAGGLMHRMFGVTTSAGRYAVKLLNPQIMRRPGVEDNILRSEAVGIAASEWIRAVPAKSMSGKIIHHFEEEHYIVYDFQPGRCLTLPELTEQHSRQVGRALGRLHGANTAIMQTRSMKAAVDIGAAKIDAHEEQQLTDWGFYLRMGEEVQAEWCTLLQNVLEDLCRWNQEYANAERSLQGELVISHRDLDPKNVMWDAEGPVFIDWEAAGPIHPACDLFETAKYWATNGSGAFERDRFFAFIQAYQEETSLPEADWEAVYARGFSMLEWLEYSLKRSLWMECSDAKEQMMGTEQVAETIADLKAYADNLPKIQMWMQEMIC